jgi:hypothetical protein
MPASMSASLRKRPKCCVAANDVKCCQELTNAVQQRASSFDNSVGALLKEQRHIETERLCNFEIDRQLELDRGLDREIGWLCATENAIDILAAQ